MAEHHDDLLPIRGYLLKWARESQGFTLRQIQDLDGPSPAYQSEVERGQKFEVRSHILYRWIHLLHVTEPFARGRIPRYLDNPAACRGLAAAVGERIRMAGADLPNWSALSRMERSRSVLRLVSATCPDLPRVVLAWVLGLEVQTLDAMLTGAHPVMPKTVEALIAMTALPDTFFQTGQLDAQDQPMWVFQYSPALELCRRAGITPDDLLRLVERHADGEEPELF